MWYLYLDESGDLGFDFVNKKPSDFFVVCILQINSTPENKKLSKVVKMVLRRKSTKTKRLKELKGSFTPLKIKKYLYTKIKSFDFSIYAVILDKKKSYKSLWDDKERIYSRISYLVLDKVPLDKQYSRVNFIIDRSKSKQNLRIFDKYILLQMKGKLQPRISLNILHLDSATHYCIQAVDLFCWGIFRKYERKDFLWYDIFKEKIKYEELLLL